MTLCWINHIIVLMVNATSSEHPPGALHGLRVVDATQMLAGPIAAMRLGDLGADVIKVEPPHIGEFNRTHGFADVDMNGEMTTFLALNRNKRSVVVDLKSDAGREVFLDIVRSADVFIQNYRVGTAKRLGIDYESLKAINPRLVYCSISGYGSEGPGAGRPGQDLIVQGYSGSMFSVGSANDAPIPGGLWAADAMTGYSAVIGILSALWARQTTDEGQLVDVSMLGTVLDAQIQELVTYLNRGILPERREESSAHVWIPAPYGVYRTKNSWLTMSMCPLDVLGEALDSDVLREMKDYRDGFRRSDEIYRLVRPLIETRTTAEWIEHFDRFNIWTGPVYDYSDLDSDPQVAALGLFTAYEHPTAGTVRTVDVPLKLSGTPGQITRPAPLLGEHTTDVLSTLPGYTPERIARLLATGGIAEVARPAHSPEQAAG